MWTKEELEVPIDLCLKYQVKVIADEIHHDFVFPGHKHTEFAPLNKDMQENCIICTAPSKTFNIAGLGLSNIFIPNKELRTAFQKELDCTGLDIVNLVSMEACKAAYSHGEDWLEQLLIYIKQNSDYVQNFLAENLPQITMMPLDGTYLAWLDFSGLQMSQEALNDFLLNKAKIWLNSGGFRYGRRRTYATEHRLSQKCIGKGDGTVKYFCQRTSAHSLVNKKGRAVALSTYPKYFWIMFKTTAFSSLPLYGSC